MNINDIMLIEKKLLEINTNNRFDLLLEDYLILQKYLKDIGRITNTYFYLQEDFYNEYKDKDKLKEYNQRLLNEEIHYDSTDVGKFIEYIELKLGL